MPNTEILFNPKAEPVDRRLEQLKQLFPECFDKEGAFLTEKFEQALPSASLERKKDFYHLNWLGKAYAKVLRDAVPTTLLAEDLAHNQKTQHKHSQNLLIKGDNLEVLKHLQYAYKGAVKMIYIDPPYNTGTDGFVYQDDRKFSPEQLAELADVSVEEATRILNFTAKKSNSHSAWLTFMYPRLYVAKQLLRDDGVIFISIDDNEQAQLKLLCDEVFGEENFVAKSIHKNNSNKNQSKFIGVSTEYIFIYAKNIQLLAQATDGWRIRKDGAKDVLKKFKALQKMGLSLAEIESEIKQMYKRPKYSHLSRWNKVDENGVFKDADLSREGGRKDYTIINPNTGRPCIIPPRGWGKSYDELLELQAKNLIWYGDEETAPGYKSYIEEDQVSVPDNFWYFDNSTDTRFIKNIFGALVFDNPKPLNMIKRTLELASNKNNIVLDFFAGSGTTAHAVMQLNAEDGGNRQFILAQLPEATDKKSEAYKAGYETIFDITKARIERAAEKIQSENPDYQGDLGFKIFETVPDFRTLIDFEQDLNKGVSMPLAMSPTIAVSPPPEKIHTLLTTWRVYDGQLLSDPVYDVDLGDRYTAYRCAKQLYLLNSGFYHGQIKALLEKLDNEADFVLERIVIHGDMIESARQQELKQAIHTYNNKKSLHINLLVRY